MIQAASSPPLAKKADLRFFISKMSDQISSAIIQDAIVEIGERHPRVPPTQQATETISRLCALLRPADHELELLLAETKTTNLALKPNECPLCDGRGSFMDQENQIAKLRFPATAPPNQPASELHKRLLRLLMSRLSLLDIHEDQTSDQNGQANSRQTRPALTQTDSVGQRGIEALLAELRAERLELERLKAAGETQAAAEERAAASQHGPSHVVSQKRGRSNLSGSCGPVSSNIQRIKRMDTLKCQKLKRKQLQQQESDERQSSIVEPQSLVSSDTPITEEADDEDIDEQMDEAQEEANRLRPLLPKLPARGELRHEQTVDVQDEQTEQVGINLGQANVDKRYNYQALKSSLASIVGGLCQKAQLSAGAGNRSAGPSPSSNSADRRRRFNLNPFAGLALGSPFGSPVKRAMAMPTSGGGQPEGGGVSRDEGDLSNWRREQQQQADNRSNARGHD